ncbi:MAG: AmmeMemoRadiSam system protein A [Gammaproteobacteria bacterium]|nr:AmmeMemoRadiSam system protein A [Gammaproteobacteria bacterium]
MEHFILDKYSKDERQILLKLAADSISYGLTQHKIMAVNLEEYPAKLQKQGACFVTLQMNKQLRGCIGSLKAHQPLVQDIVHNAYAAAFSDPRFRPLRDTEFPELEIHLSILNPSAPMHFGSETDLIQQLRPGIDGLILTDQGHRGTFLPSVWESLPTPELFISHLKLKAGLPQDYWSDTLLIERYTVEAIP